MESGVGSPAALCILYMDVCRRLGLPLAGRPVEEGRYFLAWPQAAPLTVGGEAFVVDPYGGGALMAAAEVTACCCAGWD